MNIRRSFLALALVSLTGLPVQAAWDNVFQPACNNCRPATSRYYAPPQVAYASPVVVANSAPCATPCPAPQPCTQCTTNYVQRSYYQPVTTYESKSYYEPVTSYQTSYYYEPVTTYRYSCYVDPCTGCSKQVACPQTSYALKSQCSPVQSWVERCMKVPVQSYQQAFYYEPQTTCSTTTTTTTIGAPIAAPPAAAAPPCNTPGCNTSAPAGPAVGSQPTQQYYFAPTGNVGWQSPTQPTPPAQTVEPRIAADSVQGQVTRRDGSPKSGTQILFVNATNKQVAQTVSNDNGRFNVTLPSGSYYVYFASRDNGPAYQGQVQVRPNQRNDVTLVNQ